LVAPNEVDIEQEPEKDISAHVPEPEEEEERSNPSDSEDNLFTDEQIAAESERYKKKTGAKRRSNRSKRDFKTRSEVVTRERNVAAQSSSTSNASKPLGTNVYIILQTSTNQHNFKIITNTTLNRLPPQIEWKICFIFEEKITRAF